MADRMTAPGVTVVLPVYNGLPLLERCLASLAAQDLADEEYEVVAVDDGSTDGSGDVLDAFAAAHRNVRVIHQANSGWPGQPRNVGTEVARGEFVLYVDADDRLATNALRRLLAFAREHDSDIVVPGTIKLDGDEIVAVRNCGGVKPTARLKHVFRTMSSHKLFRRALLVEHGIRFPEGAVTYEDGIFLAQVAPRARRLSVLGDQAYYVKDAGRDRGGISRARRPFMYERTESVMRILDTLRELTERRGPVDPIAIRLHHLLLRSWRPRRFLQLPRAEQDRVVAARRRLFHAHVPRKADHALDRRHLLRSLAFATGKGSVVRSLAHYELDKRPAAGLRRPRLWRVLAGADRLHREAQRRAPAPSPGRPRTASRPGIPPTA
jgi:glycosyltransferase involved in cell wall biosynthesis